LTDSPQSCYWALITRVRNVIPDGGDVRVDDVVDHVDHRPVCSFAVFAAIVTTSACNVHTIGPTACRSYVFSLFESFVVVCTRSKSSRTALRARLARFLSFNEYEQRDTLADKPAGNAPECE
jgi:hypothetical protein